jgi:energy-coupling factor transport system permease protein
MTAISLQPSGFDPTAFLARANPVAKLAASTVIAFGLLLSVDVVTAGVALGLELAALPWCGVPARRLLRRSGIILVGAVPAAFAAVVFGQDAGAVLVDLGPFSITQGSLTNGAAIFLRIVAIGLPGIVLLSTTDPTDLADGLAQIVRLPARFTLAALAATRLFGVMVEDWRSMSLARRARGLGGEGPIGLLRNGFGQVFALLVLAIRRATVLATTMESRGFGSSQGRTWARPSRLGWGDLVLVLGAALLVCTAIWAGIAAGTWHLLLT